MGTESSSWWRETIRLYLRYLVAVIGSTPAGLVYVHLLTTGHANRWTTSALVMVGLALATAGWHLSRLFAEENAKPEQAGEWLTPQQREFVSTAESVVILQGEATNVAANFETFSPTPIFGLQSYGQSEFGTQPSFETGAGL